MAAFSLLCVFLPFVAGVIVLFVPAVIDLVMRTEHVPPWWGAPLVLFVPFVLMALTMPAMMDPGIDRVAVPMFGWAAIHIGAAGVMLVLATGLAFSRGLRPGGETLRRRRTSLVVIAFLLGLMLLPWLPGLVGLVWVIPPAWAGLFWVIALNRRGPLRLERGRSVSASFLFAAALSFLIGAAHGLGALELVDEPPPVGVGAWIVSIGVLAVMAGGLRYLTGPPAPAPLLATAASGVSLVFPLGWWLAFSPVPWGIDAPVWEDFSGDGGSELRPFATQRCLTILDASGGTRQEGPRCPYSWSEAMLVDARTPLSHVSGDTFAYLVEDGRRHTWSWGRYDAELTVREENGRAAVYTDSAARVPAETHDLGPGLTEAIGRLAGSERPLHVHATPNWSMQDFISMCASLSERAQCKVVP